MNLNDPIHCLKNGDISGLETLVKMYQVEAVRAADLITRDIQQAQDIVQSAFIRIYDKIEQFDETRPFKPWFMRIVVNDALKQITRNHQISLETPLDSPNGLTIGDLLMQGDANLDDYIEIVESQAEIWEALGQLNPEQRAVIVLRYYLDFSEEEISESLNSPKGTIKWRLHKARQQLRTILKPLYEGGNG